MKYRQHFPNPTIETIRREGRYRVFTDLEPQKIEFTSLSDALNSLIPIYGPWIIFGIVALESAGVPLPGETILIAAALLAATARQINIVVVVLQYTWWSLLGVSLRLWCLCSGRRNLQDFRNAECDRIGPIYCGGICPLNFHSTK